VRILVVDDEQIIADTLTTILTMSGFEAKTAYSGEQAIAIAAEIRPNVLISDVLLRGMNGVEAAIRILGQVPNCKIILFSGQAATLDLLRESRELGYHFEVLSKPVDPRALLARLPGYAPASCEPRPSFIA
jgi:CheY-like chemotaxis protein